jgi:hypothetical protein
MRFDQLCKLLNHVVSDCMAFVISSVIPFPNIFWWCKVLQADEVVWDVQEHFEKMTFRNRYHIAGANGLLKMSIPIHGGREHKSVMGETRIANQDNWQKQHWRTIVSAYSNTPYFEFYRDSLEQLFNTSFEKLADFNLAAIHWLKQQLNIYFHEEKTEQYRKEYPDALFDLRQFQFAKETFQPSSFSNSSNLPTYHQVFEERNGFIPNLSLLDLLFAEGPYALRWLREYAAG